eukprot:m.305276 g.305276  ORF g.305276 m.305276 type:complete len:66 (-) comp20178_c0_seq4:71-268(-)
MKPGVAEVVLIHLRRAIENTVENAETTQATMKLHSDPIATHKEYKSHQGTPLPVNCMSICSTFCT